MEWHDWPEQKMTIEKKYNSLIENGSWELVPPENEANIITRK